MAIDVADWLQLTQLAAPGVLGTITCQAAQQPPATAFTVSPFATALVVVPQNVGTSPWTSCKVTGGSSGAKYASVTGLAGAAFMQPIVCPITGAADNPYTVTILLQSPAAGTLVVATVYQLFGTGVEYVATPDGQPLPVVLMPGNNAGPQQAQLLNAGVLSAIAVSGTLTVIAGVGGQYVTVYGFSMSVRAGVSATVGVYESTMEDTSAAVVVSRFDINWATAAGVGNVSSGLVIPQGLRLPLGQGLKIVAVANPGTMLHAGNVLYTVTLPA